MSFKQFQESASLSNTVDAYNIKTSPLLSVSYFYFYLAYML